MKTMKAVRFETYGPPANLSVVDVERPSPRDGEVLIEIRAAAINPSDVKNVAGWFHAETPRIPGRDFAGVVIEGGGDAWNGKEVWGSGSGLGVRQDGTHAQFVSMPVSWLAEKPTHLSMQEAASVGVPYVVSWSALVDAAELHSGQTVLITGAAGAVGRAATQIAHWKGAQVIGAERSRRASEADMVVNVQDQDLVTEVKRLTGGRGADAALDTVGGPLFEPVLKSLRIGGRQVAISSAGQRRVAFDLVDFYHELKRIIGVDSMKLTGEEIAACLNLLRPGFEQGVLKPSAVQTWPIDKAIEAYQVVERGGSPAKQVLLPSSR